MDIILKSTLDQAGAKHLAWEPICELGDGPAECCKFSGGAWIPADAHWPLCENCRQPLQLLLQLNCAELPIEFQPIAGTGLIQLFYCVSNAPHCESECEAWFPNAKSVLARRILLTASRAEAPPPAGHFPARKIVAWGAPQADYPCAEEALDLLSEAGQNLTQAQVDILHEGEQTLSGDKLGGWPNWVQGVEYPNCPVCDRPMQLLFQLDSEHNLPYLWGDYGVAHLSVCHQHPENLAFGWAC